MRKPGVSGVPFHFVRVDIAGNISKRFSGTGIRFARFSGSCPRWDVHAAFLTPGRIRTHLSRMPDGTAYFCVARTIRKSFGASDWCAWGRDDELIRENCDRSGAEFPFPGQFHDLAAQVRLLLGLTYRLGLDEALARFGLDFEGQPHDALADARNLARLHIAVAGRLR